MIHSDPTMPRIGEAVEMIVKALVSDPAAVDVRVTEGGRGAQMVEIRVAQGDIGKVIGRAGKTIRALRTLLQAAGVKHGRRYMLDIIDEQ